MSRMRRVLVAIAAGVVCLWPAGTGHAGQVTQPMNVSLAYGPEGPEVSLWVQPLSFHGAEYGLGTATITVEAPHGMTYIVFLDQGVHSSPGDAIRHLGNGTTLLQYQLYRDADRLFPWGDGTFLGQPVYGIGVGGLYSYAVYGRTDFYSSVPGGLPDGTYTDFVTVKVEF